MPSQRYWEPRSTAFKGIGFFKSLDEARRNLNYSPTTFKSNEYERKIYDEIYQRYLELYRRLSTIT